MSRGDDDVDNRGMVMGVPSKRKRDRPKQKSLNSMNEDLRERRHYQVKRCTSGLRKVGKMQMKIRKCYYSGQGLHSALPCQDFCMWKQRPLKTNYTWQYRH